MFVLFNILVFVLFHTLSYPFVLFHTFNMVLYNMHTSPIVETMCTFKKPISMCIVLVCIIDIGDYSYSQCKYFSSVSTRG